MIYVTTQFGKALRHRLVKLKGSVLQHMNRVRPVSDIFHSIYFNRRWGDHESVSGTGSKVEQTKKIREVLPQLFARYKIGTFADIPCGDYNWMKHVDLSHVLYVGGDIVVPLIQANRRIHASPGVTFFPVDILEGELPCADLMLCRDCLVHFSDRHVLKAIANIKRSHSRFLLTTTFPGHTNFNIVTGSWRPINLERSPFCFPPPLEIINEQYHPESSGIADKSLALWQVSDLP